MILPGETEAGSAGKQPCRGIVRRAHRDDERSAEASLLRFQKNHIGSVDPDALKIPARRAEYSLTESALSPFHVEPTQGRPFTTSQTRDQDCIRQKLKRFSEGAFHPAPQSSFWVGVVSRNRGPEATVQVRNRRSTMPDSMPTPCIEGLLSLTRAVFDRAPKLPRMSTLEQE